MPFSPCASPKTIFPGLSLVYTPLNGSGSECVERLLAERSVFENFTLVPEQAKPDGNFPTCPYPNPEIREAMADRT